MTIGAVISAGIHSDPVRVHATTASQHPPHGDLADWDEVCEASVHAPLQSMNPARLGRLP
jgi:hypothetical protein